MEARCGLTSRWHREIWPKWWVSSIIMAEILLIYTFKLWIHIPDQRIRLEGQERAFTPLECVIEKKTMINLVRRISILTVTFTCLMVSRFKRTQFPSRFEIIQTLPSDKSDDQNVTLHSIYFEENKAFTTRICTRWYRFYLDTPVDLMQREEKKAACFRYGKSQTAMKHTQRLHRSCMRKSSLNSYTIGRKPWLKRSRVVLSQSGCKLAIAKNI